MKAYFFKLPSRQVSYELSVVDEFGSPLRKERQHLSLGIIPQLIDFLAFHHVSKASFEFVEGYLQLAFEAEPVTLQEDDGSTRQIDVHHTFEDYFGHEFVQPSLWGTPVVGGQR